MRKNNPTNLTPQPPLLWRGGAYFREFNSPWGLGGEAMGRFLAILLTFCFLTSCESAEEIKQKRYFAAGQQLYETHCANCHQIDGKGLAGLYPPIAESDFLTKNKELIVCGMKRGINDTLTVNGQRYTQPMPSNNQLYALDIAEITTYIYVKWGNEKSLTEGKEVERILRNCQK